MKERINNEDKLKEVSEILKKNGINIEFGGDYSFVKITFQGNIVGKMEGSDSIIELGNKTVWIDG